MIFLQANWIFNFVCAFVLYGAGKAEHARQAGTLALSGRVCRSRFLPC